jgi:hypothetical protein
VTDDTDVTPADVDAVLRALGASRVVVGHTIAHDLQVHARFDHRVIQLDTGMIGGEFYPGGRASALEIQQGVFSVVSRDGTRVRLFEDTAEPSRPTGRAPEGGQP